MNKYISWTIVAIVVAVIIGGIVWYGDQPGQYDKFATCIKQSGATFFGAFWCPHCQEEKSYFGKSWTKLPYVECSTPDGQGQTPVCTQHDIQGYPTWVWSNGATTTGTLTLDQLSTFTGCPVVKG